MCVSSLNAWWNGKEQGDEESLKLHFPHSLIIVPSLNPLSFLIFPACLAFSWVSKHFLCDAGESFSVWAQCKEAFRWVHLQKNLLFLYVKDNPLREHEALLCVRWCCLFFCLIGMAGLHVCLCPLSSWEELRGVSESRSGLPGVLLLYLQEEKTYAS